MKKLSISILLLTVLFLFIAIQSTSASDNWAVKASYTESCSCSVPCPCTFGGAPTMGHCHANGLMEIEKGHVGDVQLDGISVVLTTSLGEWVKFYVSDNASDEQLDAAIKLIKMDAVFGAYFPEDVKVLSVEKAPITVEKSDTMIKFSVANSTVEIGVVAGLDGKPIKIQNLPMKALNDHTQYKSVTLTFKDEDNGFEYTGTNGLTSNFDISSE